MPPIRGSLGDGVPLTANSLGRRSAPDDHALRWLGAPMAEPFGGWTPQGRGAYLAKGLTDGTDGGDGVSLEVERLKVRGGV